MDKKIILLIGGLLLTLVAGVGFFYFKDQRGDENNLSIQEIEERVMSYLEENAPETDASVIGIEEESNLFKMTLKINGQEFLSYASKDGKLLFPQVIELESSAVGSEQPEEPEEGKKTIGNFSVNEDEICYEDGKPIVYFFGSSGCSHCNWEHPIMEEVVSKFEGQIAFHNNMDGSNDRDVFEKYSSGSIPTLVLGCKYSRIGSGEKFGREEETEFLTALICKLTNNQPDNLCSEVQNLIEQIDG